MQTDELLRFSAPEGNDFAQPNLMAEKPINFQQDRPQLDVSAMPDSAVLVIPISFIMVWTIFVFMSSDIRIFARHKMLSLKNSHQVPCKNCRFFQNNPYLQCAVHPDTALTSQAIHCSDFRPQKEPCHL
ncbi:MAG TPA: hypothetical protein V6D48_24980 [Oculatellaceae cyanobacterium]